MLAPLFIVGKCMKVFFILILLASAAVAEEAVVADAELATEAESETATATELEVEPPHPVDERVRELLDELELNYDITDNNNFSLVFDFDGGRSQQVFIRSRTYTTHDMEVRDVWSTAYQHRTKYLPEYLERRLLMENFDHILGNWVRRNNDIVYMVKLPVDASAEALEVALYEASEFADELEAELHGNDEL